MILQRRASVGTAHPQLNFWFPFLPFTDSYLTPLVCEADIDVLDVHENSVAAISEYIQRNLGTTSLNARNVQRYKFVQDGQCCTLVRVTAHRKVDNATPTRQILDYCVESTQDTEANEALENRSRRLLKPNRPFE